MHPKRLYPWKNEGVKHVVKLGKWQAVGQALLSFGVILARHTSLTRIVEEIVLGGRNAQQML
ncbi:MAG: hypothetical protein MUF87_12720 [Anaerolineae bacterium]|jgi:hypothetical protein|nr:hypothetical protein [Anaerolineae bacterium]